MDQKKQKTSKSAATLHDVKEEPGLEANLDRELTAHKKRRKTEKKQKSELDVSAEAAVSETAAAGANDSEFTSVVAAVDSSPSKRRPAKSDRNSGVVRIIEKSQHKRVQRTDNIEEALQLDVGIGSCHW